MNLKERIQQDMKNAMRAKDQRLLGVIRLLLAAVKQREIDERITLDDEQILSVIQKMIKQRRDSYTQYQQANRPELAEQEAFEINILEQYLPAQLSDQELDGILKNAITETNATSIKDLGKVMGLLKSRIQGRADLSVVSQKLKSLLESP